MSIIINSAGGNKPEPASKVHWKRWLVRVAVAVLLAVGVALVLLASQRRRDMFAHLFDPKVHWTGGAYYLLDGNDQCAGGVDAGGFWLEIGPPGCGEAAYVLKDPKGDGIQITHASMPPASQAWQAPRVTGQFLIIVVEGPAAKKMWKEGVPADLLDELHVRYEFLDPTVRWKVIRAK